MSDPLLHLSSEALTQLTNAGLVKRALREAEAGAPAALGRDTDGVLRARFADGVITEFAPGQGVADARCSCGAALCRHRLIVIFAWQRRAGPQAPRELSSPGAIEDAALEAWAGPGAWAQAQALRERGLLVDIRRADASDPVPTALLPHASVRFHGGSDPGAAQSDAAAAEHRAAVVLACLAFRIADADAPGQAQARVQLGAREIDSAPLHAAVQQLVAALLRHGLADGAARHAMALSQALDAARQLGATWLLLALGELERWLSAFDARSARFNLGEGLTLLAEVVARMRAASAPAELAAQHALGVGERLEVSLARVRLRSLGLRIEADGEQRQARLALLDPDTATRIAWRCAWDNRGAQGADCATRSAEARVSNSGRLRELAQGQLVTVSAFRRADGELRLGTGQGGRTSLLAQSPDWSDLPPGLVLERLADWRARRAHLPPSLLCPRQALSAHVVFAPRAVLEVGYDPASQSLHALLLDADEQAVLLQRGYESAAPGALDALARFLCADPAPRHIAGILREDTVLPRLDPWALSNGSELCIPDLAVPDGAVRDLPLAAVPAAEDVLARTLTQAQDWLAARLLSGPGAAAWTTRGAELHTRLQRVGWSDLGAASGALLQSLHDPEANTATLYAAGGDLLLQLELTRELMVSRDG